MTNAKSLLASHDIELWHTTLRRYPEAIRLISLKKKKSELIELDLWLWNDYPEMVRSRTPESISKDELTRIMSWKLIRGKNRPTLLNLIRQNQESLILSVTTQALESLRRGNWNEALEKLTELRGVGPATSSAILAPLAPENIPFMADEVLESCLQNFRDYNMKSYLLMRSKLLSTSSELCVEDPTWTMENIGKALWTFAVLSVNDRSSAESNDTESASKVSKKRSRVENSRETQTEDIGRKNDEPPASKAKVQSRTLSGRVRKEVDRFVPPK